MDPRDGDGRGAPQRIDPGAEGATDTRLDSGPWAPSLETRVPGLTVLWHPDPSRIGYRLASTELAAGRPLALGRLEPLFTDPAGSDRAGRAPAPLGDARISRTPLRLLAEGEGVRLERAGSRTPVEIDGEPLSEQARWDRRALDEGVVLVLGQRVVLLLHRLDPVLPPRLPRFDLIGDSPEMVRLRQDIERVADLDVTVLVRGETGTGKELVAHALHRASPRHGGPFVAIDMAALPPTLAAAELFGAERGAFTGADRRRKGHFRRAAGGTLFLDEIGEAPAEVQGMLLRVLETRQVRSVGGEVPEAIDVRLVSATDLDLEAAVGDDRFKAPLLHRLSGFVLRVPPLRDRREDFGRLFLAFLVRELEAIGERHRLEDSGDRPWLPAPIVARLARFPWPGNVRQLANAARQLVIANRGESQVRALRPLEDLLGESLEPAAPGPAITGIDTGRIDTGRIDTGRIDTGRIDTGRIDTGPGPPSPGAQTVSGPAPKPRRPSDIREHELLEALRRNRFRPRDTAAELGIARGSLYELMEKSPRVRKASELGAGEIEASLLEHGQSTEAAAEALEVSVQALRRQMGKLGLGRDAG